MRLFRHVTDLPAWARGAALALGNFDGVHRGHVAVLEGARAAARRLGAPFAVMTFEPHPRSRFRPDQPPFRLTPLRMKARVMQALGVEQLFVLRFDRRLLAMAAETFVEHVLVEHLGIRHVATGRNFRFGHQRMGDAALLERLGQRDGFGVHAVEMQPDTDGTIVSSTRIREALQAGRPAEAARLLGRLWEIDGRVRHGDSRGRHLGFPTANLGFSGYLRPAFGVYAVRATLDRSEDAVWFPGVANIGRRPTVDGAHEWLEVHLFDRSDDLYGRHLRVQFVEFLRGEQRFAGVEELKAQIARDVAQARAVLGVGPRA